MDNKQKNEKLQSVLQRYDSYYSAIGIKGNTYLTINVAFLGGLMTGYFSSDKVGEELSLVVVATLICNFAAIINILTALQPFVDKKAANSHNSVFSVVIGSKDRDYKEELWDDMDEDKWNQDLKTQAAQYARGMKRKFDALSRATWLMAIQVTGIVIFALALLIHKSEILK
jgi:predicted metalloendopeptidase